MKRTLQLTTVLASVIIPLLLASCSSPFAGADQFDIGLANAMQMQSQQAMMTSQRAPMRLQPLTPLQP